MRKLFTTFAFLGGFALLLSGCGGGGAAPAITETQKPPVAPQGQGAPGVGQTDSGVTTSTYIDKGAQASGKTADGTTAPSDSKPSEGAQTAKPTDETKVTPPVTSESVNPAMAGSTGGFKTIYFDYDKSAITPQSEVTLKENAKILKAQPNSKVTIEGHCDERGTNEYNQALGERRAGSAKKYLADLGVEKARVNTISYGEEKPVDAGHDENAWSKNRRAEFKAQ